MNLFSKPKWTVLYNIVSQESSDWVGTGWEFFNKKEDAKACYDRHCEAGNCPTMRPFHFGCDAKHLGAVHTSMNRLEFTYIEGYGNV